MNLKKLQIIYKNNKPEGIRDEHGFLFFFSRINKYDNQEERYREEIQEQYDLADFLLEALKKKGDEMTDEEIEAETEKIDAGPDDSGLTIYELTERKIGFVEGAKFYRDKQKGD